MSRRQDYCCRESSMISDDISREETWSINVYVVYFNWLAENKQSEETKWFKMMKIVDSLRWTRLSKRSLQVVENKWIHEKQWIHSISRNITLSGFFNADHHHFSKSLVDSSFENENLLRYMCLQTFCKGIWYLRVCMRLHASTVGPFCQGNFLLRYWKSVVALSISICLVNNLDESHWEWNRFLSDCQVSRWSKSEVM